MKRFALVCFVICALGMADTMKKPVIHMASSPEQVTYYSSSFDEPSKFDFKYLEWAAFVKKHRYAYRMVEGKWVREEIRKEYYSMPLRMFIPPSERRGGLIYTKPISGEAVKK